MKENQLYVSFLLSLDTVILTCNFFKSGQNDNDGMQKESRDGKEKEDPTFADFVSVESSG